MNGSQVDASLNSGDEVFLRQVIDASPNLIFVKDGAGRFRLANKALADAYGCSVTELLGRTDRDFNRNPDEVDKYQRDDREVIDTKKEKHIVIESMTDPRTGKKRWFQSVKAPLILEENGETMVLGVATDITQNVVVEAGRKALQEELEDAARRADMSEMVTGVLHNVGNLLTSVNTSANIVKNIVENTHVQGLSRANDLLRRNMDNLETFLSKDPKGMKLIRYYLKLEEAMVKDFENLAKNLNRMLGKIGAINDVISAQQDYASSSQQVQPIALREIMEKAFVLQLGSLNKYGIEVEKTYEDVPAVYAQKTKLMQILVNLLKNAKESVLATDGKEKKLQVRIRTKDEYVTLSIQDNGKGIDKANLAKLFTYGFTTKKNGHGFGLNTCAKYMEEMGGKIWVESDGENKGATFTLGLPIPEATADMVEITRVEAY
jgi:PAS domain S-box-containing protein